MPSNDSVRLVTLSREEINYSLLQVCWDRSCSHNARRLVPLGDLTIQHQRIAFQLRLFHHQS